MRCIWLIILGCSPYHLMSGALRSCFGFWGYGPYGGPGRACRTYPLDPASQGLGPGPIGPGPYHLDPPPGSLGPDPLATPVPTLDLALRTWLLDPPEFTINPRTQTHWPADLAPRLRPLDPSGPGSWPPWPLYPTLNPRTRDPGQTPGLPPNRPGPIARP